MEEHVYLVLGCFGRSDDGFVTCPSVENRLLKIDDSLININDIIDYFEALKLFDRPLLDSNAIRHLTYNLQSKYDQVIRKIWTEKQYRLIEHFQQIHQPCGLYSRLIVVSEDFSIQAEEKEQKSFIMGTPETPEFVRKQTIPTFRNRR